MVWTPVIKTHMPVIKARPRHQPCPWLNDNDYLRALMREGDLARRARSNDPSPASRQHYTACRNTVKRAQSEARSASFLSSYRYARKTTWGDIGRFLITPKGGVRQTAVSGERSSQWADRMNAHSATVGSRVAAALEAARAEADRLPPRPTRVVSGAFRVRPATLPELSTALKRMSASGACGADGITISVLRDRDREDPNNYRPVSILPTVAKLVESVHSVSTTDVIPADS